VIVSPAANLSTLRAASGIGFATAARAAAEGMTVVPADIDTADIDTARLRDAAASLRGAGADVHPAEVDVSDRQSVADLFSRPAGRAPS
jgi:NAD(P)-dependent dehydrogenase (short-subunit alcohol dehydrogenase family)